MFQLYVCEMLLEQEGVMGHVTLQEFQMDFIPLDTDLLSLEFPLYFKSFYLVSLAIKNIFCVICCRLLVYFPPRYSRWVT